MATDKGPWNIPGSGRGPVRTGGAVGTQTLANTPRDFSKPGGPQTFGTPYQTTRDLSQIPYMDAGNYVGSPYQQGVRPTTQATSPFTGSVMPQGGASGYALPTYGSSLPHGGSVFSPELTSQSEYAIRAQADRASNLPHMLKQTDRPGVSRSAGSVAAVAPQIASLQSAGREGAANQFLDDFLANERYRLDSEMVRERERLGLSNVQARLMEQLQRQQQSLVGGLTSLI